MTEPSQPASSQPGAAPQAPPSQIIARLRARPHVAERYEDGREIARGGMGAILRVFDTDLRRQLAMKVMLDEPGAPDASKSSQSATLRRHARFLEEAQITGQLDHPGIVPVHELGLDAQGRLYFTMKLVKGRDLREVFEAVRSGADGWNLTRALGVLLRVCEAMAFAHEKGVIHRDLKPANVMVGRFGEVYVMDWGLAKVLGQPDAHDVRLAEPDGTQSLVRTERKELARASDSPLATMDGDIVGTPCYMAPEQARGRLEDIGPHSDVYSLGSMLYELLAGQMPYVGPGEKLSPGAVLQLLIQGPPRELAKLAKGVPEELIAICEKAMARDLRQRYPSMLGVADDLRAFLEGRVVRAHETGAVAEFKKWIARNKGFAGTAAAAAVLALGLSGALVLQQVRAKERLQLAKDEADRQRGIAEQKRGEAEESQRRAEGAFATIVQVNELLASAKKDAEAKEVLARRKSYVANIAAAGASLRFHDLDSVRARLAECPPDLRGWEWAFLDAQCEPSMALLARLGGDDTGERPRAKAVLQLATDPAERVLVAVTGGWSIGDDPRSVLTAIDLLGGASLGEFDTEDRLVLAIAVAPDGATLASASTDKQVRLYELATRVRKGGWSEPKGVSGALAFHPDGRRLALATPARTLRLVDARSGALEREWSDPPMQVRSVSFSPDGSWLAAGTVEGEVLLLDVRDGALRRVLGERGAPIHCVAVSPDGRRVLGASGETGMPADGDRWSNSLREWDATSGALLGLWREHESVVSWCGYMRAGRVVASTSHDGSVRVRDTVRGEELVLAAGRTNLTAAAPARGGYALVTGSRDGEVRAWDAGLGESLPLLGHRMRVAELRFLNDGVRLVSRSDDGTVRLWDARTGEQQLVLSRVQYSSVRGSEVPYSLAASPVGERVAVGSTVGRARVFDAASGALEREVALDSSELASALAFDSEGRRLAVGSSAGKVTVFDLASGAPGARLRGIRGAVSALEWLDGGERMAVGTDEGQLGVWDLAEGRALALHDFEKGHIEALQPASGGGALWVDAGARLLRLELARFELSSAVAPSGLDGRALWFEGDRRLACRTAADSIGLYDAGSAEALLELRAAEDVSSLAISGDGRMLAAGFVSGAIRVWSSEATAARSEARRAMLRARELALPFVERLFEERGLPREEVEAALRADETLAPAVRDAALRLAARTRGEPLALRVECFDPLRSPKAERADCKIALWQALTLERLDPKDDRALFLVGAARYRLGQLEAAADCLARSAQLRRSPTSAPEACAFAAMTLARLGRVEEARVEFDKLRAALLKPAERAKLSNIELRDEAAAWLATATAR